MSMGCTCQDNLNSALSPGAVFTKGLRQVLGLTFV